MDTKTNIEPGPPSRKRPRGGEGFFLEVTSVGFLLGRLISTDAAWSVGLSGANLVYIYNTVYKSPEDAAGGRPKELLISPVLTNNLPWSRGYFRSLPATAKPIFPSPAAVHHFFHARTGIFYDENGEIVTSPQQPVGEFLLQSFFTIDDLVSDALSIPRASEL